MAGYVYRNERPETMRFRVPAEVDAEIDREYNETPVRRARLAVQQRYRDKVAARKLEELEACNE